VKAANVILVDDMIDTGGTLCKAAEIIVDGAEFGQFVHLPVCH
jgi:phosphoribosylpyrophosphate synthetase